MIGDPRGRAPDLEQPGSVAAVAVAVVLVGLAAAWGWTSAGPLGALLGALLGAAVGTVGFAVVRGRTGRDRLAEQVADLRQLPPEQSIQVLTALLESKRAGSGARLGLQDGLLGGLNRARSRADAGDLDGALSELTSLAEAHPRSPAVPAAELRLLLGREQHQARRRAAASRALTLALPGGMNRLAAELASEIELVDLRALKLSSDHWRLLATVLDRRGEIERAAHCRDAAAKGC